MNEPRWRLRDTVAIGLLKINPFFFSIKTPKKPDKEMMLKSANISKINAYMLLNFALSTNMVPWNSKMMIRRRRRRNIEQC